MDDDRDGIDSTALNVYQQRWWGASSSTLKEYRILEVPDDNGIVIGRLEYVIKRDAAAASIGRFFLRRGGATHWAHLGGPTIREGLSSERQSEVLDKIISSLPKNISFGFIYDPHVSYVDAMREAFERHGFERSALLTFERHPTGEDVISGLGGRARNHIRAALARKFSIGTIDAKTFIQFYNSNLKALGKSSYAPLSVALTLIEEGLKRKQVHLFAARQKDSGELSGAIACFSDRTKFYYSMSTHAHYDKGDPRRRQNEDAIKCLLVTAMYDAQRQGLIYSTEGTPVDGAVWLHAEILALGKHTFRREVQTRLAPLRIVCDAAARRLPPSITRFLNARLESVLLLDSVRKHR